ncbi:hypothetical protein SAMN05892877_117156 [Rhizobium subbaraonis]|uniref:HNH endonuclease n=1 Tax=Rhizobium subbaraonis TaxID=908946 RepID=A0A285UVS0_9HYPH|nr:hypothetical protein [Rhizobium subbaraonis]SOC45767.1 hypothetical protein SAMN05892877_117156 [Rhizobium subbaraonis]
MANPRLCSISNCGKPAVGRGWCSLHWQRWQKHGDPLRERSRQAATCSIDGCARPTKAKSLCQAHYTRLRVHGHPLAGRTAEGEPLRFLQSAIAYDGDVCLRWPYGHNGDGYGLIWQDGKFKLVTRLVCEAVHGPPPTPDHESAHSCGKGHEGCCAPNHLHWATTSENHLEKANHGTDNRGGKHPMVKLTDEDVRTIRTLHGKLLQREIAELFGIGRVQVGRILSGQRWGHLD